MMNLSKMNNWWGGKKENISLTLYFTYTVYWQRRPKNDEWDVRSLTINCDTILQ